MTTTGGRVVPGPRAVGRRAVLRAGGLAAAAMAGTALGAPGVAAAGTSGAGRQLAFLNHTYCVLDQPTVDAVAASEYLHEFGAYSERTTDNGQVTYTGRYLLGRETYLEMFPPAALPAPTDVVGASGLAHSPDRAGTIDEVLSRLEALGVADPVDLVLTQPVDGVPIPWFRVVEPSTPVVHAEPWVMEYLPSWFVDSGRSYPRPAFPGDVSRDRYNADDYRTHLFRDVVGIDVSVPPGDLEKHRLVLSASGLTVQHGPGGLLARGRRETVRVRPSAGRIGWNRLDLALARPVGGCHRERLGTSVLTVGPGPHARWRFGV